MPAAARRIAQRASPRKTPLQARSRDTVRTILEAAARVLARESLDGFNTNRVAMVAGVSVGSLYQYFPGKDALVARLIDDAHEALADAVENAVEATAGLSLRDSIDVLAEIAVDQQFDHPLLATALDHEERRLPPSPTVHGAMARIAAGLETILSRHAGRIASMQLRTAAVDCLAIARGLVDDRPASDAAERAALRKRVSRALLGYLTVEF